MFVKSCSLATLPIVESFENRGASFALNLKLYAKISDGSGNWETQILKEKEIKALLSEICEKFSIDTSLLDEIDITVSRDFPSGWGLGEREAEIVAIVIGFLGMAAKKTRGMIAELIIDKYLKTQVIFIGNRIVNPPEILEVMSNYSHEFSRLSAALFGNFCVTQSTKILRRGEMEDLSLVIFKEKAPEADIKNLRNELEILWNEALKGNLYVAMKLNSELINPNSKVFDTLAKVSTLEGTIALLSRNETELLNWMKKLEGKKIVKSSTTTVGSIVMENPRRKFRVSQFMKIKGDQPYVYL